MPKQKGTMSEAELHFLQERMRGGLLNKAKRGELRRCLPIGYEYDFDDNVVKTPDLRAREGGVYRHMAELQSASAAWALQ